ncbi:MAG: hypothetical protein UX30_C0004G0015 [Candidatus Saccharibacteria bacterium GW2011_GWA2_46_10]|nr:MAG: hypothetical protein UX30_C0004G0015 [Candidatus Saccharibacteria bacterium GW2011_GWA2_46_10]
MRIIIRQAFTAIETAITIAIVGITAGISVPMYRNFLIKNELDLASGQMVQAMRSAQIRSQSGTEDSKWGVFAPDGTVFRGESYETRDSAYDDAYPLPPSITVSGLMEVTFDRLDGVPEQTGTVTLTAVNGESRSIAVNSNGMMFEVLLEEPPSSAKASPFAKATGDKSEGKEESEESEELEESEEPEESIQEHPSSGAESSDAGEDTDEESNNEPSGALTPAPAPASESCSAEYSSAGGSIVLKEKANVTFKVLGSHARYGDNGPQIQVRLTVSLDGGRTWRALYDFRGINGGESQSFENVPAGSDLLIKAEGRYGWMFKRSAQMKDGSNNMRIFENGAAVPQNPNFSNPQKLQQFLREKIKGGAFSMGGRKVLVLAELRDSDLESDYQDAAIEVIMEKPACEAPKKTEEESLVERTQENSITICHFPPGSRDKPNTISIDSSAWPAHKLKGDRIGPCAEDRDLDGVPNFLDLCPDTHVPESVPSEYLLFGRFALTSKSQIFMHGPRKKIGEYTLNDTNGCSCEQIIDAAENKKQYYFNEHPFLYRNLRGLFPSFTSDARKHGCIKQLIEMVKND